MSKLRPRDEETQAADLEAQDALVEKFQNPPNELDTLVPGVEELEKITGVDLSPDDSVAVAEGEALAPAEASDEGEPTTIANKSVEEGLHTFKRDLNGSPEPDAAELGLELPDIALTAEENLTELGEQEELMSENPVGSCDGSPPPTLGGQRFEQPNSLGSVDK